MGDRKVNRSAHVVNAVIELYRVLREKKVLKDWVEGRG